LGSHVGIYEDCRVLGHDAVQSAQM